MKTNSLVQTNPYLKDPIMREKLITESIITSCGVEGIKANFNSIVPIKSRGKEIIEHNSTSP